MFYIPIVGALLEGIGTILDKKIIQTKGINHKNYVAYGFLALSIVMLPFLPFLWKLSPEAFLLKNIIIFAIVVIASVFANILMVYALKRENITVIEPIKLMHPLFNIILAFILSFFFFDYSNERNYSILILSSIASITLIASHVKKHHFDFDRYILAALLGSFLFSVELVISKAILPYYSGLTFYFFRCFFVFLIALLIFKPKITEIPKKIIPMILAVNIIWVIYRVILYWGYLAYGVVFTTMLFILAPVFIYIFARIFLKEKIELRNIIAAMVIVICVILAIILKA